MGRKRKYNPRGTPPKEPPSLKRKGRNRLTRHHIVNKCRGGGDFNQNLLLLTPEHHRMWHILFGNKSISEAIRLLQRIERIKSDGLESSMYVPPKRQRGVIGPVIETEVGSSARRHPRNEIVVNFGRKPKPARKRKESAVTK